MERKSNKAKKGIAVQIGLRETSEYYYLTQPNWKSLIPRQSKQFILPDEVYEDIDTWKYIGIDRDPTSISLMIEKYGVDATWVCAHLQNTDRKLQKIWDAIGIPPEKRKNHPRVAGISLSDLFFELSVRRVHTLMVDVDGAETPIFERYDWSVIPKHIQIELHPFGIKPNNRENIHALFESVGYEKVREYEFANGDYQTHFIHP